MDAGTLLHRQVNPSWVQEGRPSSQTFKPTPKDEGKVSVYDGSMLNAEAAHTHFTTVLKLSSVGCVSVTIEECQEHSLSAVSDPEPYPAHCVIDMTELSDGERRKKATRLTELARARGWTYQPGETPFQPVDARESVEAA